MNGRAACDCRACDGIHAEQAMEVLMIDMVHLLAVATALVVNPRRRSQPPVMRSGFQTYLDVIDLLLADLGRLLLLQRCVQRAADVLSSHAALSTRRCRSVLRPRFACCAGGHTWSKQMPSIGLCSAHQGKGCLAADAWVCVMVIEHRGAAGRLVCNPLAGGLSR